MKTTMSKTKFPTVFFALVLLTSCSSYTPTVQPTSTDDLSVSATTNTITVIEPTQTRIPQANLTSTDTPVPLIQIPFYTTKQVVLLYTHSRAALGGPEEYFDTFFGNAAPREATNLVLYSDGQLILQKTSAHIMTKILSESEMNELLYQLDVLGFHMIGTNQKHDDTDLLYDFGGRYLQVGVTDGSYSCLSIKDTRLCYYDPYEEFVMKQVKLLFDFIDSYSPDNMTLYEPDRILLFVGQGQDLYNQFEEQSMTSISWSPQLPQLNTSREEYIYLDGERAQFFYTLADKSTKPLIFSENGIDYSVLSAVVLPHELISQP